MGSFKADVYPYRYDRAEFTRKLLEKIDKEWKVVTAVDWHKKEVPGNVQRCRIQDGKVLCKYEPVYKDKRRMKAIIRGWRRSISDRYLDLQRLQQLEYTSYPGEKAAFDIVRKNAPAGAVKFFIE